MTEPAPAPSPVRLDIQLLRAVAVGVVVLYHFWPERFPGGFVGVDVFFVVSGLLITDHLMREGERSGRIRILRFWARRARRLLPLAFVVLLVSLALAQLVLPPSQQRASILGVLWSSLYVQNWALAASSTNYLARDQQPLLTQHFWTLSVEEQFYLVWPILLTVAMIAGAGLRRAHPDRRRRSALLAVVVVLVASFAHSVALTASDPGPAYLATTTRAWEFAAGAVLAFVPRDLAFLRRGRRAARVMASWAGYGMIAGSTLLLQDGVPYPSATALLPVVGAALCLMAGDVRGPDPSRLAALRPVTWIGDISYGIYLWHWPLLLAVPLLVGAPLVAWQELALIAAVIGLAALSKRFVEDPIRFSAALQGRATRGLLVPLVGTAVVAALVAGSLTAMQQRSDAARATVEAEREPSGDRSNDPSLPLVPSAAERGSDYGGMYECFDLYHRGLQRCDYGDPDAPVRLAAVGDSHMAHLVPALRDLASARGWSLTTFVGMNCDALTWHECADGDELVDEVIGGDFDGVVTSASRASGTPVEAVDRTWTMLLSEGVPLIPIVDVPVHDAAAFACIDASGDDVEAAEACASPRSEAIDAHPDRMQALSEEHGLEPIDMTDVFCDAHACASVLQNTYVYQDSPASHLTGTMSRALADRLGAELDARLDP